MCFCSIHSSFFCKLISVLISVALQKRNADLEALVKRLERENATDEGSRKADANFPQPAGAVSVSVLELQQQIQQLQHLQQLQQIQLLQQQQQLFNHGPQVSSIVAVTGVDATVRGSPAPGIHIPAVKRFCVLV
jgi:sensor histidine kinase YesM